MEERVNQISCIKYFLMQDNSYIYERIVPLITGQQKRFISWIAIRNSARLNQEKNVKYS